ncbi:hypothetical protein [Oricola indica]|uniref:hypothetical protein n=1 Tax=Oricola indica TaxID=2872591 RepID=UPI001CBA7887|nr:hypothetical protein [Oricola indica]
MTAIGTFHLQPALAVMKGIATPQNAMRGQGEDTPMAAAALGQTQSAETTEASEDIYFGTQMTVTKLMFLMMEKITGYLNGKLEVGRDGDLKSVEAGNQWRKQALLKEIPVDSEKDFTIPKPGENGVTFREVAGTIKKQFSMGFLAGDRDLLQMLEKFVGFRLYGTNAADIIESFTDPDGPAARRVRAVLENGLAGQEGSKVSQRLERAAEGPRSVSDVLTEKRSAADVVDEETIEEDREALETARMQERLQSVEEMQDKLAEALETDRSSASQPDRDTAMRAYERPMEIIQQLAAMPAGEETDDAEAPPAPEVYGTVETTEQRLEGLEEEQQEIEDSGKSYAALAEAYDMGPEREREEDEDVRTRFLI